MAHHLRTPVAFFSLLNLSAILGSTYYLRSHHVYNLEEHEARMDELEGKAGEGDRGKKMDELYATRGRDEKGKES